MKTNKYIILIAIISFFSLNACSSSSSKNEVEYVEVTNLDFGEGTYRPNPFKFLDNIPPFSWMGMPDSVKKEATLIIQFNEDAIRSGSNAKIKVLDKNGNSVEGVSINSVSSNIAEVIAKDVPREVTLSYTVNPAVGDSLLSGIIVVDGSELDQVNKVHLTSNIPIAKWYLNHEVGTNWLRWLILVGMVLLAIAILCLIGYLIYLAIGTSVEIIGSISMPVLPTINYIKNKSKKRKSYKKNIKKDNNEDDDKNEFKSYVREIAPLHFEINPNYVIPNGVHHKNSMGKTCGEILMALGDSEGIIKMHSYRNPCFDKDGGTQSGRPLEVTFQEGIEAYLYEKDLRRGTNIRRNKLHDEAFRRIAKKYGMDELELKVFKGDSSEEVIKPLMKRWRCSEQTVFNKCGNPYRLNRVLHECRDGKTVQLVPWVYHHISHDGGIEAVVLNYQ